ncbi:hypothetical protein [uncultured Brevibacillus sp.]|nr:hypothetical protein [uncultured Brevibacillus sp.]
MTKWEQLVKEQLPECRAEQSKRIVQHRGNGPEYASFTTRLPLSSAL